MDISGQELRSKDIKNITIVFSQPFALPWSSWSSCPTDSGVLLFTLRWGEWGGELELLVTKEVKERLIEANPNTATAYIIDDTTLVTVLGHNLQVRDFDLLRLRSRDRKW